MLIVDMGSGNTCQNSVDKACTMVKEIADLGIKDTVIKWQLFQKAGDNIPLNHEVFERAYRYAAILGLRTTASVFDNKSLGFLMTFGVPFIKIANTNNSKDMIKAIPETMPIVISTDDKDYKGSRDDAKIIYTISKYPADKKDYEKFGDKLKKGISDHTDNFDLYHKYKPEIYEIHYKPENATGLDAGKFARTLKQIQENIK